MKIAAQNYNNLVGGDYPWKSKRMTIAPQDPALEPGTLMAKITASGKLEPFDSAGSGGQEIPYAILLEEAPVNVSDQERLVLIAGDVNKNKVILTAPQTGETIDDWFDDLRDKNIYLSDTVKVATQSV